MRKRTSRTHHLVVVAALTILALVAAACGGGNGTDDTAVDDQEGTTDTEAVEAEVTAEPAAAETGDDAATEPADGTEPDGTGGEPTEGEPFVFGGSFTLTGPAAFLGVLEEAGIRFAIDQFMNGDCIVELVEPQPCEGDGIRIGDTVHPIEFISYDDASDSRRAIDNVTRLAEQDGAAAVWGPRMNEAVVAAAAILEPQQVLEVCSICSSPAMTIGREFGFDITDTGVLEKRAMASFVSEDPSVLEENGIDPAIFEGRSKTAIIGRDELYVIHGAEGWEDVINESGQYDEFDSDSDLIIYPFGTTDFAPFVAQLAELDPDIVLMDVYVQPDMLAIMQEMQNQGLDWTNGDVMLLGNDVFMLQSFVDAAAEQGTPMNSDFVWGWQEQNPGIENPELAGLFDEATLDRIEAYTEGYNEFHAGDDLALALGGFARGTYDAAMWLFFAAEAAGSLEPAAIADAWKNSSLNGLRGPEQVLFERPDTGEKTGQLFVPEYIMGVNEEGTAYYTGIQYRDEIYEGEWVYGDALPQP